MSYKQDYCLPDDCFKCSETSVVESEPESVQEVIPCQDLPLDTSSYQSVAAPLSESAGEEIQTDTFPLDTSHYRKSSVIRITYRVTKK